MGRGLVIYRGKHVVVRAASDFEGDRVTWVTSDDGGLESFYGFSQERRAIRRAKQVDQAMSSDGHVELGEHLLADVENGVRRVLVRVLGDSLNAAGGFVPNHDDVFALVEHFGVTRAEAREVLGYEEGEDDYLPHVWPGEEN